MRAVKISGRQGLDSLEVREVDRPDPTGREILVRVRASAMNRSDVLQREGKYPAPQGAPQDIPGIEFAGEVEAGAPRASRFRAGDRVFGIVGGGAHAEYLVTDERACAVIPPSLGWEEAAAIPEAYITAHDALVTQARLRRRERLVITAVGSGVGLAAAQLASAMECEVFGVTRTPEKLESARRFGAAAGVAVAEPDEELRTRIMEWSDGRGADVVLDLVGGDWTDVLLSSLGLRGRLMLVGVLAGARSSISLATILRRRLTMRGTVLRSRTTAEKVAATRAFARDVVPLLTRGVVRPVVDSVFSLDDIRHAHARMEGNESFGKVVITMNGGAQVAP
jgi:NADPH:quinone reductase